jgi:hypothetical protein
VTVEPARDADRAMERTAADMGYRAAPGGPMKRTLPLLLAAASLAGMVVGPVAWAGYEASSFKKEDRLGKNYWNAASALDAKFETCWQIDPEADNAGSWIQLDVPSATEVDKLGIVIGWQKDDESFADYARVKTARVEIFALVGAVPSPLASADVSFEDKPGWQTVELPDTKIPPESVGGRIKLTVQSVYPGKDFGHLAVSEVRVQLKEFDATTFELSRPFDSELPSNPGINAIDGDAKTFWAAAGQSAAFAFKAKGYGIASLAITPGPRTHARPKTITVTANQSTLTQVLTDTPGAAQNVIVPYLSGYTGGAWGEVEVKIVDSYPGDDPMNGVAITELKAMAGSIEEF